MQIAELPYRLDSAYLFQAIADSSWAASLDSGLHHPGQSRYDILAAQPYVRLVTRGNSRLEDEYQETFDKARAMLKLMQQAATSQVRA